MRTLLVVLMLAACTGSNSSRNNVLGEDMEAAEDMGESDLVEVDLLPPPPTCGVTIARGGAFQSDNACCQPAAAPGPCIEGADAVCLTITGSPTPPYCQFCGQTNGDPCCPPLGEHTSTDGIGLVDCSGGLRCMRATAALLPSCLSAIDCGDAGEPCCSISGSGNDMWCLPGRTCVGPAGGRSCQ